MPRKTKDETQNIQSAAKGAQNERTYRKERKE
jgi:hypothetical protein